MVEEAWSRLEGILQNSGKVGTGQDNSRELLQVQCELDKIREHSESPFINYARLFTVEGLNQRVAVLEVRRIFTYAKAPDVKAILDRQSYYMPEEAIVAVESLFEKFEAFASNDGSSLDAGLRSDAEKIKLVPGLVNSLEEALKSRQLLRRLEKSLKDSALLNDKKQLSALVQEAKAYTRTLEARAAGHFASIVAQLDAELGAARPRPAGGTAEGSAGGDQGDLEYVEDMDLEAGAKYKGQVNKITKQLYGFGSLSRPDGSFYVGNFSSGRANGHGKFVAKNGNLYEGDWVDDRAHGVGSYTHEDGSNYTGQWVEDEKCGRGAEVWADGSKYEGEFLKGSKHGVGKYCAPNGKVVYDGGFANDKMNGQGSYFFADGREYKGNWQGGHMNALIKWVNLGI
jgi:hypothetical protein